MIDAEASDRQNASARVKLSPAEIESIDVRACLGRTHPLANYCQADPGLQAASATLSNAWAVFRGLFVNDAQPYKDQISSVNRIIKNCTIINGKEGELTQVHIYQPEYTRSDAGPAG